MAAVDAPSRPRVHPDAVALSAFRVLPGGRGRQYSAVTFRPDAWRGCERTVRTMRAVGYLADHHDAGDAYAVLDVLDADGDVVQDFAVTRAGFRWLYRTLRLRVEDDDG